MSFKLLQLRTLKQYIGANHQDAGECMDRLQQEGLQYQAMIEEKSRALEEKRKTKRNWMGACVPPLAVYTIPLYFKYSEINLKVIPVVALPLLCSNSVFHNR